MTKKYRVQGIPKLVLIDGDTGKLITCEGYSCVINDKDGQEFPWRPKKVQEVIQGKLLRSDRTEVDAMESLKGKTVCLYFSAHWVSWSSIMCNSDNISITLSIQWLKYERNPFLIVNIYEHACNYEAVPSKWGKEVKYYLLQKNMCHQFALDFRYLLENDAKFHSNCICFLMYLRYDNLLFNQYL